MIFNKKTIPAIIISIVVYILFIIGVSLISEWLRSSATKESFEKINDIKNHDDANIDFIFEMAKENIKKEFYKQYNIMRENTYSTYYPSMEEQSILRQASDKLRNVPGIQNSLDSHSSGRKTIGQMYNQIDEHQPDQITYNNLHKKFQTIPREINWQDPANLVLPKHNSYNVDEFKYTPSDNNLDDKYNPLKYGVHSITKYNMDYGPYKKIEL